MAVLQRQRHHLPFRLGVPANRAALLGERNWEVMDALVVVCPLVQTAPTLRRGLLGLVRKCLPAMASKCSKKKLCHIGGGDKPDGFDPSACQTYCDVGQFLAEPDEEKLFDAIKAYVATCVVSCRV